MARTTFSPNSVPVYRSWHGVEAAGAWFWLWRRSRTKTASEVPLKVPLSATMRTLIGFTELKRAAHCAQRLQCLSCEHAGGTALLDASVWGQEWGASDMHEWEKADMQAVSSPAVAKRAMEASVGLECHIDE